jgi:plasmid replication initiation protein
MAKEVLVVSKANILARGTSTLDVVEAKVVEYCLANIHFTEKFTQEMLFKVDVDAMSKHFGMDRSLAYREIRRIAISISNKTITIPNFWQPEKEVATHWLQSVIYNDTKETLELRFSFDVIPYLTGQAIRRDFTTYLLEEVAQFRGLYCNRLYNLCKSHTFKGSFEISLVELRDFLAIEDSKYPNWGDLKIVLNRTTKEINEKSSLTLRMVEVGKTKGKVSLLEFRIEAVKEKKDETK